MTPWHILHCEVRHTLTLFVSDTKTRRVYDKLSTAICRGLLTVDRGILPQPTMVRRIMRHIDIRTFR